MGEKRLVFPVLLAAVLVFAGTARGASKVNVVVMTIMASQESDFVEPKLSELIQELQSVFKYSSYRLLGQDQMLLDMNQTGTASLPGERALHITPIRIEGNRITLQLEITKKGRQTFQTVIKLLNNGSITVGGPRHQKGYLLFNVSSSF